MSDQLDKVNSLISPYRFCVDESYPCLEKGSQFYLDECPFCHSHPVLLSPKEFVCTNRGCEFRAGSLLDFIASSRNWNYGKSLDWLMERYPKLFASMPYSEDLIRDSVPGQASNKRKFFATMLSLGFSGVKSMGDVGARVWTSGKGIDLESVMPSIFPGSMDTLFQLVEQSKIAYDGYDPLSKKEINFDSSSRLVFFPYYSDFHTPSLLHVFDIATDKHVSITLNNKSNFHFFGLHSLTKPRLKKVFLSGDTLQASASISQFKRVDPGGQYLGVKSFGTGASGANIRLQKAVFVYTGVKSVETALKCTQVCENLKLTTGRVNTSDVNGMDWGSFCRSEVVRYLLKTRHVDSHVSYMVEVFRPEPATCSLIKRDLVQGGLSHLIPVMDDLMRISDTFTIGGVKVKETSEGYECVVSDKDDQTRMATNFLLNLKDNVVFPDTGDTYHYGSLEVNDSHYPVMLSATEVSSINQLLMAARGAQNRAGPVEASAKTPSILDPKLMKFVFGFLNHKITSLRRTRGCSYLGWSQDQKTFTAPAWQVTERGLETSLAIAHPRFKSLALFDYQEAAKESVKAPPGNLPTELEDILNMAVAMVARSFLGNPIQAVPIKLTPVSKGVLAGLFSGLRQVSPHVFNPNMRMVTVSTASELNGYPYYGLGCGYNVATKITGPAFILTDQGHVEINTEYPASVLGKAASVLNFLVASVAKWLVETSGSELEIESENAYELNLILEGRRIVKSIFPEASWGLGNSESKNLEKFLRQFTPETIHRKISMDFKRQVAIWDVRDTGVARTALVEDFYLMEDKVALNKDNKYTMDVDLNSTLEILKQFYRTGVALREKGPPTEVKVPPKEFGQSSIPHSQ